MKTRSFVSNTFPTIEAFNAAVDKFGDELIRDGMEVEVLQNSTTMPLPMDAPPDIARPGKNVVGIQLLTTVVHTVVGYDVDAGMNS